LSGEEHMTDLSLRDYFAAKAMTSLIDNFLRNDLHLEDPIDWMEGLAGDTYLMADAMLKARLKVKRNSLKENNYD
jgi:hypothetical protein